MAQRGPVCVGLDTDPSYLPEGFAQPGRTAGENVFALSLIHILLRYVLASHGELARGMCDSVRMLLGESVELWPVCAYVQAAEPIPEQIEAAFAPVSYTHLDVYKRQASSFGCALLPRQLIISILPRAVRAK